MGAYSVDQDRVRSVAHTSLANLPQHAHTVEVHRNGAYH